jgi:hypothetical protein
MFATAVASAETHTATVRKPDLEIADFGLPTCTDLVFRHSSVTSLSGPAPQCDLAHPRPSMGP